MKKNVALSIISVLAVLAVAFGILYMTNNSSKSKQIEKMTGDVQLLSADIAEKTGQIETLTAETAEQAGQIETLTADAAEKTGQIEALTADTARLTDKVKAKNVALDEKNREVKSLMAGAKDKDGQIAALTAEAAEKDGKIGELTAESAAKDKTIETLTADAAAKDNQIEALNAEVKTQAEQIASLTAELEAEKAKSAQGKAEDEGNTEQGSYLFFGIPWGTPVDQLHSKLPAGVDLGSYAEIDSFRSIPGFLYMGNETMYKVPIGYRSYGHSKDLGDLTFEGYKVEAMFLYAIKLVGEDGKLSDDPAKSAFAEAYLELKPADVSAAYDELLGKMKVRYGEPAEHHETKGICEIWRGTDGSMFELQKDGELIKIKYVAGNAGELIENANQAYKNPGSVRPQEEKKDETGKTGTVEEPDYASKYIGTWKLSKIESNGTSLTVETMTLLGYSVSGECIIGKEAGSLRVDLNGEEQKGVFTCEFSEKGVTVIDTKGVRETLFINEAGELVFKNDTGAVYFVKAE